MNREGLNSRLQRVKGIQQFQAYEQFQLDQEKLRSRLGSPVGRSPPLTVAMISPTSQHWRSRSQRLPKSPKSLTKLPEADSPKVKINVSNIKTALLGHSSGSHSVTSVNLRFSLTSVALPSDASYQYAFPDPQNLDSFNPFLRAKPRNRFFPATLFDLDTTDYSEWQFPTPALARWRLPSGDWTWRPCQLLQFDSTSSLFTVQWSDSSLRKQLSRFNIRLPNEEEEAVLRRFAAASQRRDLLEASLRYETRLTLAAQRFPDIVMPPSALSKILSYLKGVLTKGNLDRVCEEIHYVHRLNIVNFVFEIEHFITKARLIAR